MNAKEIFDRIERECKDNKILFHRITPFLLLWRAQIASASKHTLSLLSEDEQKKCKKYLHINDQHLFVLARSCVRQIFGLLLNMAPEEVPIEISSKGKPLIGNNLACEIEWNIAHSGLWVVGALSYQRAVGIDIEAIRDIPEWQSLCKDFLSPNDSLWPCSDLSAFFKAWTGKEAFSKMTGLGLHLPLKEIVIQSSYAAWGEVGASLSWVDMCPGYVICLATSLKCEGLA